MAQKQALGEKIKELRGVRGWSQAQLAMKAGITRSHISLMELGRLAHPRVDVFMKLAKTFDIPIEELYQAAGYIREARVPYSADRTPEQMVEDLKLGIHRLEKKIKEQGSGGTGERP